jgi:urease accessory protein
VGGDQLHLDTTVEPGAWAVMTTPGATKFYRSAGAPAQLWQSFRVGTGGTLEWLPQEQIIYTGAEAEATTRVELAHGARCFAWELNCLGRPAGGPRFGHGALRQRFEIWREGEPLLLENGHFAGDGDVIGASWGLAGQPAFATLVAAPASDPAVDAARSIVAETSGAASVTQLDELLVVRWRGAGAREGEQVREALWARLRPMVMDRPACRPRIWNT